MAFKPDRIILHCSATADSGNKIGFKEINRWHKERGWMDKASGISCGYHYIIRRSGLIDVGRPESSMGAHCHGHNNNSLGICYVGTKRMTENQIDSLMNLYSDILTRHDIPTNKIFGHYEFTKKKDCPCQDMNVIRALLEMVAIGVPGL